MVQFSRPVNASRIGTTAWFRNEAFLRTLAGLLRQVKSPSVLFHACSTGEEPYSFAIIWQEMGGGPITIDATDIEPTFIEKARQLGHPRLTPDARNTVSFLPPASCSESIARTYDAVICMNALCYLAEDEQRLAIDRMASCASRYLCITAGSPRVVKRGIEAADLRPVWLNWIAIYYGWRERLKLQDLEAAVPAADASPLALCRHLHLRETADGPPPGAGTYHRQPVTRPCLTESVRSRAYGLSFLGLCETRPNFTPGPSKS